MTGRECLELLQWALPRMRLRYRGFRNVRGQVCKRISRRMQELGMRDAAQYRRYLEATPAEWETLRALCRVTITRFYRDRDVFQRLRDPILPRLASVACAEGRSALSAWCAGCAGGEEPYTLSIIWHLGFDQRGSVELRVEATDFDAFEIERARRGIYPEGALRELPPELRDAAFDVADGFYSVRSPFRSAVEFRVSDLTMEMPRGPFDLVLCRNLAFTYFDEELQKEILARITERLTPEGVMIVGKRESIPLAGTPLVQLFDAEPIYGLTSAPYADEHSAARSGIERG